MSTPSVITSTGYNVNSTDLVNYLPVAYGCVTTVNNNPSGDVTILASSSKYYNSTVTINPVGGNIASYTITVTNTTNLRGVCIITFGGFTGFGQNGDENPMTGWSVQAKPVSTTPPFTSFYIYVSSGGGNPAWGFYPPYLSYVIY
jgi:hypothetical protein